MKNFENFAKSLEILKKADFLNKDALYKMGIIAQFNLTFMESLKAMQEILENYGIDNSNFLTLEEMLKTAYSSGFIKDDANWLLMLKNRNILAHVYDDEKVQAQGENLIELIKDNFIKEFLELKATLELKLQDLKV